MIKRASLNKYFIASNIVLSLLAVSCAKEETTVKLVPNANVPENVPNTPPTQNPGSGEKLTTDPICTIPLIFPSGRAASENESAIASLVEQPSWIPETSKIQPTKDIEPPTMICLFVDSSAPKAKVSIRLEYEDRFGRVQYTLKDHPDLDYANQTNSTTAPPVKKDTTGATVTYQPSYYVDLSENKFELFLMPTWGFITIKGAKQSDGFFYADINYIKFLNAPIEPYYLSYNTTDYDKIKHCTGDSGQATEAKIAHPDRPQDPPVECARAHRFVRSAFHGPWDATLGIFKSHNEYTGIAFDYRVEIVRQYTDKRPEALSDFMTVLGQKPTHLGTIKFKADQVWSGIAP